VVHWSIVAIDPERQRSFYAALFKWVIGDGPIMSIEAGIGAPIQGPAGHIQAGSSPGVSLYVQVANLRATIDTAIDLGAKETMPPFDLENGQTLAAIEDPEGNFIMLVQQ
jgi:predicted enzyme related to lactoylglutathione lyase